MQIDSIDHLVLTVGNIHATVFFYTRALAMEEVISSDGRVALHFGGQKINLQAADAARKPRAGNPQPGSADLCFLTTTPLDAVIRHLQNQGVAILEGPVRRQGAAGSLSSIYLRDPDGNLIEVANLLGE